METHKANIVEQETNGGDFVGDAGSTKEQGADVANVANFGVLHYELPLDLQT